MSCFNFSLLTVIADPILKLIGDKAQWLSDVTIGSVILRLLCDRLSSFYLITFG